MQQSEPCSLKVWHKWDPSDECLLFMERLLQLGSNNFLMAEKGPKNLQLARNPSRLLLLDLQTLSNTSQMAGFRPVAFHTWVFPPSILMLECTYKFSCVDP